MLADVEGRQKAGRPWVRTKHLTVTRLRFREFMESWRGAFGDDFHALGAFDKEGRLISFLFFLRAYAFVTLGTFVSRTDSLPLCPNNLIIHRMIEWAAGHGVSWVDLGASGYANLAHFKSSFGAEPLETVVQSIPFNVRGRVAICRAAIRGKTLHAYYSTTNLCTRVLQRK